MGSGANGSTIIPMDRLPQPPVPRRPDLLIGDAPRAPARRPWLAVLAAGVVLTLAAAAVVPFVAPGPTATDYAFLSRRGNGDPVRWNPCEPVHYVVNASLAPPGSIEDVHEAVRRISEATGIAFVYEGVSDERPSAARGAYLPSRYGERWAPVLIGWVDPDGSDIPFHAPDGIASAVASPLYPDGAWDLYVSGWVAMNAEDPNPPGFDAPWQQGPVLLHELGHVMGLGHVDASGEIMQRAGGGATDLGPGDLEGLRRLGSSQGCLPVPRAHA
jgi:hypothetical protein